MTLHQAQFRQKFSIGYGGIAIVGKIQAGLSTCINPTLLDEPRQLRTTTNTLYSPLAIVKWNRLPPRITMLPDIESNGQSAV